MRANAMTGHLDGGVCCRGRCIGRPAGRRPPRSFAPSLMISPTAGLVDATDHVRAALGEAVCLPEQLVIVTLPDLRVVQVVVASAVTVRKTASASRATSSRVIVGL